MEPVEAVDNIQGEKVGSQENKKDNFEKSKENNEKAELYNNNNG